MTTTRSTTDIDQFIDSIDPRAMRDGRHLRAVAEANAALADSEAELRAAVAASREAGDSWTMIGMMLGMSRQNAHRKFSRDASERGPADASGRTP